MFTPDERASFVRHYGTIAHAAIGHYPADLIDPTPTGDIVITLQSAGPWSDRRLIIHAHDPDTPPLRTITYLRDDDTLPTAHYTTYYIATDIDLIARIAWSQVCDMVA